MAVPTLITRSLTPKVLWSQTDDSVILRILLANVKDYYLRVEDNFLQFSTIVNDDKYCICSPLFGTVIAENTTHENLDREIKIRLTKAHKWLKWPRVEYHRVKDSKNNFFVPDPNSIEEIKEKNDVEELQWKLNLINEGTESLADYKKRMGVTCLMPAGYDSTDEEESDDERLGFGCD